MLQILEFASEASDEGLAIMLSSQHWRGHTAIRSLVDSDAAAAQVAQQRREQQLAANAAAAASTRADAPSMRPLLIPPTSKSQG